MSSENQGNTTRLDLDGKEVILIGTAHVSRQSVAEVKEVIEREQPDAVCVELDEQRFQAIQDEERWKKMDVFQVLKEKKAGLMLTHLILSSFQERMAQQFGIKPGQEMLQGIQSAQEVEAQLVLADRPIQITFSRIWHQVGFKGKVSLLMQLFSSLFQTESISEEELEQLKSKDMLTVILDEFTTAFPRLKKPLIDERDQYMAQKIKEAPGQKVVAVLGAAHVPGVSRELHRQHDLARLSQRPPKSRWPRLVGWAIPLFIIALVAYTFYANPAAAAQQTISWVVWNGLLAGLGAALALAHPLAILVAMLTAPFTSLNPLLAAGWFAGFVQAWLRRPQVSDFETLAQDAFTVKTLWQNKVTRILLVVILTNLGSTVGTVVAGTDIVRRFLELL